MQGGRLSNPTSDFGARFAIVAPERIVGRSDRRAFFDLDAEVPVVELCLPVDAMGERLVGGETGLFEQGKAVCRVRERERIVRAFSGCEEALGEREL